jgi:hypothetical protein
MTTVTPNEYAHTLTTVTMLVCLRCHKHVRAEGNWTCILTRYAEQDQKATQITQRCLQGCQYQG